MKGLGGSMCWNGQVYLVKPGEQDASLLKKSNVFCK